MNFKEIHAIVKELDRDKAGYISIPQLIKRILGSQAKFAMRELEPNHPVLYMMQTKGTKDDMSHWKIHAHDSIEFTLRVMDLVNRNEDRQTASS